MTQIDPQDSRLDQLLRNWSVTQEPEAERLDHLQSRILDEVDRNMIGATVSDGTGAYSRGAAAPAGRSNRWSRMAPWVFAGTVALVALAVVSQVTRVDRSPVLVNHSSDVPPEFAWLKDDRLRHQGQLFANIESLFDRRVRWVAETRQGLTFGLTETPDPNVTGEPLALRVVVERRAGGERDWSLVWAMDVISREEEVVEIPAADGAKLRLWAYRLPDGLIFVESDMALTGRNAMHSSGAQLLEAGQPGAALTVKNGSIEYRVHQSAAPVQVRG